MQLSGTPTHLEFCLQVSPRTDKWPRRTNVLNFREKSENPLQNMTNFRNSSHSVQLHLDVDYGAKYGSENIRNMYFEAFRPVDSEFDVGKKLGSRDVRISALSRPAIYLLLLNAHPVRSDGLIRCRSGPVHVGHRTRW